MKLKKINDPYSYRRQKGLPEPEYSIAHALVDKMQSSGYGGGIEGQISTLESDVSGTMNMIGELIETLYETGVISEETVMKMLNKEFEKVEEDV